MRNIQIKKYRDSWIKLQHVPALGYDRPFIAHMKRSSIEKTIDEMTEVEVKKSFQRQYYNCAWYLPEFARWENLTRDNETYMKFRERNYDGCKEIVSARYRLMHKEREKVQNQALDELLHSPCLEDKERELIEKQRELIAKNQPLEEETGRFRSSLIRTKSRVEELALCNDWQYFCTFTIDKNKNDRYDLDKIIRDFSTMVYELRHEKFSFCENMKYIIVPERHKPSKEYPKGAWHIHGLMMGVPDARMKFFNKKSKIKRYLKDTYIEHGQRVGKFLPAEAKFGASTCIEIRDDELSRIKIAKYFVKYVTKDLRRLATEKNRRMFTCSKGLKRADVLYSGSIRLPDWYKFDYNRYFDATVGEHEGILRKIACTKIKFQLPIFGFSMYGTSGILSVLEARVLRDSGRVSTVDSAYTDKSNYSVSISPFRLWYINRFRREECLNDLSRIFAKIEINFSRFRARYVQMKFYSHQKRLSWSSRAGFVNRPKGKFGYWKFSGIVGDPIYSSSILRSPSELYKLIARDVDFVRKSPYSDLQKAFSEDAKRKGMEAASLYSKIYADWLGSAIASVPPCFEMTSENFAYVLSGISEKNGYNLAGEELHSALLELDRITTSSVPPLQITDKMTMQDVKFELATREFGCSKTYDLDDALIGRLLSKDGQHLIREMQRGENSFLIKDVRKDGTVMYNNYDKLLEYLKNNKVF